MVTRVILCGWLAVVLLCGQGMRAPKAGIVTPASATPPMGWNAWNAYQDTFLLTDASVRATADGLVSYGLLAAGYSILLLDDDPWMLVGRGVDGNLQPNPTDYPNGMPALASYIHGKGLKFGTYASGGTLTCVGGAGSFGYEDKDAALFVSWGADYLKYDVACNMPVFTIASIRNAYERMCRAIRRLSPTMICAGGASGVEMPVWQSSVGDTMARVGADMHPRDAWNSISQGFTVLAGNEQYGGPGHWLDMDALLVGHNGFPGGPTWDEGRTQMSLWSILASPLFIGADVRAGQLAPEALAIYTNADVIAVDQDALGIVGKKAASVVCGGSTCEVWAKPLSGGACAIGAFNRDAAPHDITITFADVEAVFPACGSGPYTITKNLWTGANPGTLTTNYTAAAVPAHGVTLIRVAP